MDLCEIRSTDRLAIAHRTLRDGTAFLGSPARPLVGAARTAGESRSGGNLLGSIVDIRLLGNGLRELDGFLGLLIEEVAGRIDAASHDRQAFARLRNTANKLRLVRGMMDAESPDHHGLRAIGRLRVCLHHCAGEVRLPGHSEELVLAGCQIVAPIGGGPGRERLVLTAGALDRISTFYRRVGDDLVAELAKWSPNPA